MKLLRTLLHILFAATNIGVIILFVLSAYSDHISPDKSISFAYLGLAFPVFFTLNICFAVYWAIARKWKLLLVSLCAFVLCWIPITHYFPFHQRVKTLPQENVIKVLTYNVMNFAGKAHTRKSPNRIIEYIAQSNADIVCLQEYTVERSGENLTSDVVFKALKMYPYKSVIELNSTRYGISGLAVFSKFPISHSRKIKYNSKYNGSSVHELNVNGKKLILVNNHLESFKLTLKDRTQYSSLIKSFDTDILNEIKGTFHSKLGPAFLLRAKQAELVADVIQKAKGDYILVCGDFNDTPISYAHRVMQGDLTDAFVASGKGMGVTYNQNLFLFRIDNILHSSNITPFNCTVDQVKYSDHYPMWCHLQLN
ncbi:endonuclease [Parabacteroides sp. 52]|uniref:endonuclease/exonuclease/phosphatase family protein n=1 Tax=unclassified Parabacteroides TaxID=2649774 RepID=UPI0013D3A415|nr:MULTISPECIES: endonuclease/exonuclease/phosphatase family protein [unclassified Parabacteroides]MDH6535532.1 endonuclease/exonuclease/phosphatase family metal-dependent hydrolase [Parabacteroides sp. PM5-20]NDV56154.1 endonuclease [Parabacteroides sp. 52]